MHLPGGKICHFSPKNKLIFVFHFKSRGRRLRFGHVQPVRDGGSLRQRHWCRRGLGHSSRQQVCRSLPAAEILVSHYKKIIDLTTLHYDCTVNLQPLPGRFGLGPVLGVSGPSILQTASEARQRALRDVPIQRGRERVRDCHCHTRPVQVRHP